jgi:hypothetical protein
MDAGGHNVGDHLQPDDDAWVTAIHATKDDAKPAGSGIVLDELRMNAGTEDDEDDRTYIENDMLAAEAVNQQSRAALMRSFWAVTLPGALDHDFMVDSPVARCLWELERIVDAEGTL